MKSSRAQIGKKRPFTPPVRVKIALKSGRTWVELPGFVTSYEFHHELTYPTRFRIEGYLD